MKTVTLQDAQTRLGELAELVEQGETVTVTNAGEPVFDLVRHKKAGGINLAAIEAFKREHGIDRIFGDIPPDFDDPLPEDFLLRPLP